MATRVSVTESELIAAVREAAAMPDDAPADAMTVAEMQTALGLSAQGVRRALDKLRAAGRLAAYRVRRVDVSGRGMIVNAYVIKSQPKAKR